MDKAPAQCQAVTETFVGVCAGTVGRVRLVVKIDKFSSCSEGNKSPRQVMMVLLLIVYHIPAHPRPTGHSPAHALLGKIDSSKSVLGVSSVVDLQVGNV